MFCPQCGEKVTLTETGFLCEKGDMEFSEHLAERLNECFILKTGEPKDLQFSFQVGGNWFCPKDGVKMIEENGYIKCLTCKISLNEFIFPLIEYHPHK